MPAIFQHYGRQSGDMMDYKAHIDSLMGKANTRTSIYSKMFFSPRTLKSRVIRKIIYSKLLMELGVEKDFRDY